VDTHDNPKTAIVGIVNVTADSFSDGGLYLDTEQALAHARALLAEGADWLDLGAESSNPDGQKVSAEEEIARLAPLVTALAAAGARLAIDTYKATVMERTLALGAAMINDITALRGDPAAIEVIATHRVPVVLMFARNRGPRAEREIGDATTVVEEICRFFDERLATLVRGGLSEQQCILDPGMGLFLGSNPEPSLRVLAALDRLRTFGRPLYLSVSRKSFIGTILGGRPATGRAYGTLAAEIWAYLQGIEYIRTHAVGPLVDAVRVLEAIRTGQISPQDRGHPAELRPG